MTIDERPFINTLNYDVTAFTRVVHENELQYNDVKRLLEILSDKLKHDLETFYDSSVAKYIESFAKALCFKLKSKRPIYDRVNYIKIDDPDLPVGCPLKVTIGFEIVFDSNKVRAKYSKCLNVQNKMTSSGDGARCFDIFTNDPSLGSMEHMCDLNIERLKNSDEKRDTRICSSKLLKQFQEDVIELGDIVRSELQHDEHTPKIIGFKKHDRGVYTLMKKGSEGIIIDLFPMLCLSKFFSLGNQNPENEQFGPNYQAAQYMAVNGYTCSDTDLYMSVEPYLPAENWCLDTLYRENELLKRLPLRVKNALKVAKYILRSKVHENRAEIDPADHNYVQLLQVNYLINMYCLIDTLPIIVCIIVSFILLKL